MRFHGTRRWLSYEVKNGVVQPKLLERHIVKEFVDRLWFQAKIKVWVINQPVGGKTPQNEAGIPDLVGFVPKRMVQTGDNPFGLLSPAPAIPLFIEVKRPGGRRRPAQERFIEEAKAGGCCAFFAESWKDVVDNLAWVGVQLNASE
jgi:hypothetical protein